MRWPPWKPHPREVREREEAEQALRETLANWPEVIDRAAELDRGLVRNHLIQKAFAIRERGDR